MERGLMTYAMGGTLDGEQSDHVVLAPPFIREGGRHRVIVDRFAAAREGTMAALPQAA